MKGHRMRKVGEPLPLRLAYSPIFWKHFLNAGCFLSDDLSLCQADRKLRSTGWKSLQAFLGTRHDGEGAYERKSAGSSTPTIASCRPTKTPQGLGTALGLICLLGCLKKP